MATPPTGRRAAANHRVQIPWPGLGIAAALGLVLVVFLRSSWLASLLALDAPFAPVADPQSGALAEPILGNAALAAAPLLIGVYLFWSAFVSDCLARRHFEYSGEIADERPRGYALLASLVVFPQILLAAPVSAWGIFNLAVWIRVSDGLVAAAALLVLLLAASVLVVATARNRGIWPRRYLAD